MSGDKIITAVEPAQVAQVAMIETQRAIARSVDAAVDTMRGIQAEVKDQAGMLRDVRERVIKIEAVSVDAKLAELEKEVEILKADKHQRDGALKFAETVRRWTPAIVAVVFVIIMFLGATGRLGAR